MPILESFYGCNVTHIDLFQANFPWEKGFLLRGNRSYRRLQSASVAAIFANRQRRQPKQTPIDNLMHSSTNYS